MVTKTELSDKIADILGLHLDFSKMSKEDLEEFYRFLIESSNLVRTGLKNMRNKVRQEYLEKPLSSLLKSLDDRPLFNLEVKEGGGKGILGLGLFTGERLKKLREKRKRQ